MTLTIAFDVYGTLIDPHGITQALLPLVGEEGSAKFSQTWRSKQLEYSFRRALMGKYEEFPVCTRQALEFACAVHGLELTEAQETALMDMYLCLPAYDDVEDGLQALKDLDVRCFAFSNGVERDVRALLESARLISHFDGIVSVDEVRSFKPDPEVYLHFLKQTGSRKESTWLVSSNPFDVIGAISAGWKSAWVRRNANDVFDPWGIEPSLVIGQFAELSALANASNRISG